MLENRVQRLREEEKTYLDGRRRGNTTAAAKRIRGETHGQKNEFG